MPHIIPSATHLQVVHQAQQFRRPFELLFGVVLDAHGAVRFDNAAAQLIERDHRAGVHLRQKCVVVRALLETGQIHAGKWHETFAEPNVAQVFLVEQAAGHFLDIFH